MQEGLAGAAKRVQLLVVHLRQECVAVSAACARAGVSADNARRQLRIAFLVHQEACRWESVSDRLSCCAFVCVSYCLGSRL